MVTLNESTILRHDKGLGVSAIEDNPYVQKGDGWIPQHIVIACRAVYTTACVIMTLATVASIVANLTVIVVTIKFKVI